MSFLREKEIAWGRLRAYCDPMSAPAARLFDEACRARSQEHLDACLLTRSCMAVRTRSEVELPRTKMAVLSPSSICGSRLSRARLTRAFFGFL